MAVPMLKGPAPSTEIGYSQWGGWGGYQFDAAETSPDLQWPQNIFVYDRMRRTDAKVAEILDAVCYPIIGTSWLIDPAHASEAVTRFVASDLGLPIVGERGDQQPARQRNQFSWPSHLRLSLLSIAYGHMPFEITYSYGDDKLVHLAKLAPRMPRTIALIHQTRAGELVSITQWPNYWPDNPTIESPIPADRIVFYLHRGEGNLVGSSILRSGYRHWLLKDRLLRIDTMMAERNGMGIPIFTAPEGASAADLRNYSNLAKAYRAGQSSGAAIPFGASFALHGVQGTLPNLLPMIQYHDEQIAATALAEFLKLGSTTTGARAVGDVFVDFFTLALAATVAEVTATVNYEVIERLVTHNWGPDEACPRIVAEAVGSDHQVTAEAILRLMQARAITPDPALEDYIRQMYRLPVRSTPWVEPGFARMIPPDAPAPGALPQSPNPVANQTPTQAAAAQPPPRELTPAEVAAQTDFVSLGSLHDLYGGRAAKVVLAHRPAQITSLAASAKAAAGNLGALATLSVTPLGTEALAKVLTEAAAASIAHAVAEAARQGVTITPPAPDDGASAARAAATTALIASALAGAASNKAVTLASLDPSALESAISDYLGGTSEASATTQASSAVAFAIGGGRVSVMSAGPSGTYYASEITDSRCCAMCLAVDGTQFSSLDEAQANYPGGQYSGCLGGGRCRGTLVAVYDETPVGG